MTEPRQMSIGFSTGAIARGDFRAGLAAARKHKLQAVELSALREDELPGLVAAFRSLDLSPFSYVSLHAPSRLARLTERGVLDLLLELPEIGVIVHPDVIQDADVWRELGNRLILENMDQRKTTGRTLSEMTDLFIVFPNAGFCFDIGHARQMDPTMCLGASLLSTFRDRLVQIHMSEVTPLGSHVAMSYSAQKSFLRLAGMIPTHVPIILESLVGPDRISDEVASARIALGLASSREELPRALAR